MSLAAALAAVLEVVEPGMSDEQTEAVVRLAAAVDDIFEREVA